MANLGLRHVALPVKNIQRAIDFYIKYLGFSLYYESKAEEKWGMVTSNGTTISFLLFNESENLEVKSSLGGHARHIGICLSSKKEVDEFYRALKPIGAHSLKLHRDGSYGFYFKDTEDNFLEAIFIPLFPSLEALRIKTIYLNELSDDLLKLIFEHGVDLKLILNESLNEIKKDSILITSKKIETGEYQSIYVDRAFDVDPMYQLEKIANKIIKIL